MASFIEESKWPEIAKEYLDGTSSIQLADKYKVRNEYITRNLKRRGLITREDAAKHKYANLIGVIRGGSVKPKLRPLNELPKSNNSHSKQDRDLLAAIGELYLENRRLKHGK